MARGITGDIIHSVGVRYRVKGSGALRTRLYNMSEEAASLRLANLDEITLSSGPAREKTAIANFQDQGIQIYGRTIHIDEVINVTKIICFYKPVAESYPIRSGG